MSLMFFTEAHTLVSLVFSSVARKGSEAAPRICIGLHVEIILRPQLKLRCTNLPFSFVARYQVEVDGSKKVGVPAAQWRNWMLQMVTYTSNQNGSIFDAFMLWKTNIEKKFEGLEDCSICYSVIHFSMYAQSPPPSPPLLPILFLHATRERRWFPRHVPGPACGFAAVRGVARLGGTACSLTLPTPGVVCCRYSLPDKRCRTCKHAFHSACLFRWFSSSQQSTCPLCRNIWVV